MHEHRQIVFVLNCEDNISDSFLSAYIFKLKRVDYFCLLLKLIVGWLAYRHHKKLQ